MGKVLVSALALVCLLSLAALSRASDGEEYAVEIELEPELSDDTRIITGTEATSDCIGDPGTPVCAVETFLACMARRDWALCERVGVEEFTRRNGTIVSQFRLPDPPYVPRYRILRVRIETFLNPRAPELRSATPKHGSVEIVLAQHRHHPTIKAPLWMLYSYIVGLDDRGWWQVLSWYAWDAD